MGDYVFPLGGCGEQDKARFDQFCFSGGKAIRQKGREARTTSTGNGPTPRASAARKPEGPGEFASNPSGFASAVLDCTAFAESLDLAANFLRQND
jgi:hypothetical protein